MQSAIEPISELRRTFEQSTYCCMTDRYLPLGELVVISTLLKRHGDIKLLPRPLHTLCHNYGNYTCM